jgi:hypothetical protein
VKKNSTLLLEFGTLFDVIGVFLFGHFRLFLVSNVVYRHFLAVDFDQNVLLLLVFGKLLFFLARSSSGVSICTFALA